MSATAVLKRTDIPEVIPDQIPSSARHVLALAKQVLNYEPVIRSESEIAGDLLRTTLRRLDIRPFSPESVQKYKTRKARKETGFWTSVWSSAACGLVSVACCVIASVMPSGFEAWVVGPLSALFVGGAVCSVAFIIRASIDSRRSVWMGRSISDEGEPNYTKPIPLFAVDTAMRIKQSVPAAKLWVQELEIRPRGDQVRIDRVARDPFLVVTHGDYTAFVEVWNEPSFNGQREA